MPLIQRSVVVPYSAKQMYDLVNDVAAYPEFLEWCARATVLRADEDELQAELLLSRAGLQKSFTTHNRMQVGKMIEIRLVDGPFKQLEGFWRFDALSDSSCEVVFDLAFEFSNFLVALAMEPVFHPIANTLVDAFCQRAEQVYLPEKD